MSSDCLQVFLIPRESLRFRACLCPRALTNGGAKAARRAWRATLGSTAAVCLCACRLYAVVLHFLVFPLMEQTLSTYATRTVFGGQSMTLAMGCISIVGGLVWAYMHAVGSLTGVRGAYARVLRQTSEKRKSGRKQVSHSCETLPHSHGVYTAGVINVACRVPSLFDAMAFPTCLPYKKNRRGYRTLVTVFTLVCSFVADRKNLG